MKYFIAPIGIIFFVILAELTISKWISTWILVVGFIVILMLFLISSRYHEYQSQGAKRSIEITKFMLKSFGIFIVILAVLIYMFGGEKFSYPIEKYLHVTVKNNNPCFYIDAFEQKNEFIIEEMKIVEITSRREYTKMMWSKDLDTPISSMFGAHQCVLYGENDSFFNKPKKLQIGVLYNVNMVGSRKNARSDQRSDEDQIDLRAVFYLKKNEKTNQIEAVMPDVEQEYNMRKKLKEIK